MKCCEGEEGDDGDRKQVYSVGCVKHGIPSTIDELNERKTTVDTEITTTNIIIFDTSCMYLYRKVTSSN